jgi:hypothetical protein
MEFATRFTEVELTRLPAYNRLLMIIEEIKATPGGDQRLHSHVVAKEMAKKYLAHSV